MNKSFNLLFYFDFLITKHVSSFDFIDWKNGILYYQTADHLTEQTEDFIIYIKGQILTNEQNPHQFIWNQYKKQGINFVKELSGSFFILLIDKSNELIYLITDQIHSKKVFIQEADNFIQITDNIFSQFKNNYSVNELSLAQYITSGFVFNSKSLIQGIHISKPSTIYQLKNNKLTEEKYFNLEFSNKYVSSSIESLRNELFELLKKSITKRQYSNNIYLSLSGGYDATSIQLLLNDYTTLKPYCFSYYDGNLQPYTDAWVAKKQTELLNHPFELKLSYDDDFENFILQNALKGQGIANACFEVNVWDSITDDYPIFVGEEFFGMKDENTTKIENILSRQGFNTWENIYQPNYLFNLDFINVTSDELSKKYELIKERLLKDNISFFDSQMSLYFNYRLPNVLLSWREFFTGVKNNVEIPLLDRDIIAFISKLPYWARNNKYLFKETLHHYFPNFFNSINRAKKSNNYNWSEIIQKNKDVIHEINNINTIIDNYIKPDAIELLLKRNNTTKINSTVYRIIKTLNRKFKNSFNWEPKQKVADYLLIIRILIVKKFFQEFEKNQKELIKHDRFK